MQSRPNMCPPIVALIVLALAASGSIHAKKKDKVRETPEGATRIVNVWYRTEKRPTFRAYRASGDLDLDGDGLEFLHPKKGFTLSWSEVRRISYGTIGNDVDTEWVILDLVGSDIGDFAAFRDGASFGFGPETRGIHETIVDRAREARAAQYDVPDGYKTFDVLEHQVTFAVPDGWEVRSDEIVLDGGVDVEGVLRARSPDGLQMHFARRPDSSPSRCETGLDAATRGRLIQGVVGRAGWRSPVPPSTFDVEVDGCLGTRLVATGVEPDGDARFIEEVAVRHRGTLYRFRVEGLRAERDALVGALDTAVATARFAQPR